MAVSGKKQIKKNFSPVKAEKKVTPLWIYSLILFLFAFVLYGNTIPNEYSLDDNLVVLNNKQVMKGINGIPEIFITHYEEGPGNTYGYRPIAKTTYAIEYYFFGENPHISHFINVLLYGLLLIVLFQLLNRIFPDIPLAIRFIIVMLYASHPLHTEVVASLKNREGLLCFIFGAAAMILVVQAVHLSKHRIFRLFLGLFLLACSILSKQTGMIFCLITPLILLQFYYHPLNFKKAIGYINKRKLLAYIIPFFTSVIVGLIYTRFLERAMNIKSSLLLIVIPVLVLCFYFMKDIFKSGVKSEDKTIVWKYIFVAVITMVVLVLGYSSYKFPETMLQADNKILYGYENPLFLNDSFYNRCCLGFMSLLFYFKLIFIPWPLRFYYGYDMVPLTGIWDYRVILSVIIYLTLLITGIYYFRRNKIISFGILFYLIGILMFTNWFTIVPGIIGERLIFSASFGFCIVIGGILILIRNRMIKRSKLPRMVYLIASLVILVYSIDTIKRNRAWKDHITLYQSDILHLQNSAKANSLYGDEIMRLIHIDAAQNIPYDVSEIETAKKHLERAAGIYPEFYTAYTNIGTIFFTYYKNYDSALVFYKKALRIDSMHSDINYGLGIIYEKKGDTLQTMKYYKTAISLDSSETDLLIRYASILNSKGSLEEILRINLLITKNEPLSDFPYINIGNRYLKLKDTMNAVKYWEKAVAVVPGNVNLYKILSEYYTKKGNMKKSTYYLQKIKKG